MRNISKYNFSGEGVLQNSVMDILWSTTEGGADQNQIAVDVRGGEVKNLDPGLEYLLAIKVKSKERGSVKIGINLIHAFIWK